MTFTNFAKWTTMSVAKRKCECGNLVVFDRLYPCTCKACGRLVYPTQKMEFEKKLLKEMKKK